MHYIRLLRSPKLSGAGTRPKLELLFTVTTDLGDSFLFAPDPVELVVTAELSSSSGTSSWALSDRGKLTWKSGMRVAKPSFDLPMSFQRALLASEKAEICISPNASLSAVGVDSILAASTTNPSQDSQGLLMPVWATLKTSEASDIDVSTRKLYLGKEREPTKYVEIEEEIGESIARHIWDAGVVAFCTIVGTHTLPEAQQSRHSCMGAIKVILTGSQKVNVLELGCGVGILGASLYNILPLVRESGSEPCTVLMTDLEEAEDRARFNIARLQRQTDETSNQDTQLLYENLDWEDGRNGLFGPQVHSRRWDLIMLSDCTYNVDMLPALVETLSALHASNNAKSSSSEPCETNVFLATKPRHASERALFDLMAEHGWKIKEEQVLPLPVLGAEAEAVEMYLFVKSLLGS